MKLTALQERVLQKLRDGHERSGRYLGGSSTLTALLKRGLIERHFYVGHGFLYCLTAAGREALTKESGR